MLYLNTLHILNQQTLCIQILNKLANLCFNKEGFQTKVNEVSFHRILIIQIQNSMFMNLRTHVNLNEVGSLLISVRCIAKRKQNM